MKFILYTSVLNQEDYDALVVPDIVKTARIENSIHDITGVLLFDGQNFTQYFEGEEAKADQLFDNILRDKRHKNIVIVLSGQLDNRLYQDWGMGYVDVANREIDVRDCMATPDFSLSTFKQRVNSLDVE